MWTCISSRAREEPDYASVLKDCHIDFFVCSVTLLHLSAISETPELQLRHSLEWECLTVFGLLHFLLGVYLYAYLRDFFVFLKMLNVPQQSHDFE